MKIVPMTLKTGALCIALAGAALAGDPATPKPAVDPRADTVLHEMSDNLRGKQGSIVHLADTIDDVGADGRKIEYAHVRTFTIMRPDKLRIDIKGDLNNRTLWKDGKTITLLDRDHNVYAELPDPGTIDQAVDMLHDKYGLSLPAADFLSDDVYKSLTDGCTAIDYIGQGYVDEDPCHHLAFEKDEIDWQLWITMGKDPRPRKLLITYKNRPGEPQYALRVLKRETPGKIKPSTFEADLPKDSTKIDFQPRDLANLPGNSQKEIQKEKKEAKP